MDFPVQVANRKAFAGRLKIAMKGKFTQETLAEKIGISVSGLKKWFSGTTDPSWSNVVSAAKACDVSLDWLATGVEYGSETGQANMLDEEVLLAAVQAVEMDLHERGETMAPEDKSRLIYLLYRTRMNEKNQGATMKLGLRSLFGNSPNGRTGRNNKADEFLEVPQRQQRKRGNGD